MSVCHFYAVAVMPRKDNVYPVGIYKKAAKRAPAPTRAPEAILRLEAAPVEEAAAEPEAVEEPDWEEPDWEEPEEDLVAEALEPVFLPVLEEPAPVVLALVPEGVEEPATVERTRVVLLLAVATMVLLPTTMVFRPVMAGIEAALWRVGMEPSEVAASGREVAAEG